MSKLSQSKSISIVDLQQAKIDKRKISMVTCYDSSFAKLVAASSIDSVLVGDSLGNVMMGYPNTLEVTLEDVIHHTKSVAGALQNKFLCADLPFGSYQVSVQQAVESSVALIKQGRAHAVKLEGGIEVCEQIHAISNAGIPVVGHLGLTPQSIHKLGGFKVQGRSEEQRKKLFENALALQDAGAELLVLEVVPADIAAEITAELKIPTIGIGAGPNCDGQVLVLQDLLGFDTTFKPKFLKNYLNLGDLVKGALEKYDTEVKEQIFPSDQNSY